MEQSLDGGTPSPLPAPGNTAEEAIPRVLVLLAAYNGSLWIAEQIQSILSQEGVRVKIVVRDDNSTDGTKAKLLRFRDDPRVSVILSPNRSGSAGQNFLTLIATQCADQFDFIALSDQDDIWYPKKLLRACHKLVEHAASGYSSATLAIWDSGKRVLLKPSGAQNRSDFLLEGAGQGCTFVMTAALYERVRRFLPTQASSARSLHFHDWAIYAIARAWDLPWIFDATPSMIYRQHANNDTGARGSLRSATRRLRLLRNGWYRQQLTAISALCSNAAPDNRVVADWNSALQLPRGLRRRFRLAYLCLRAGRRRTIDNMIVVAASIAGWI